MTNSHANMLKKYYVREDETDREREKEDLKTNSRCKSFIGRRNIKHTSVMTVRTEHVYS